MPLQNKIEIQERVVQERVVFGLSLNPLTGCIHYQSPLDIIAIKFKCCGQYYACFACHEALADHPAQQWGASEHHTLAILCGCCGSELTICQYLSCQSSCLHCNARFNPRCKEHHHLYWVL